MTGYVAINGDPIPETWTFSFGKETERAFTVTDNPTKKELTGDNLDLKDRPLHVEERLDLVEARLKSKADWGSQLTLDQVWTDLRHRAPLKSWPTRASSGGVQMMDVRDVIERELRNPESPSRQFLDRQIDDRMKGPWVFAGFALALSLVAVAVAAGLAGPQ